MRNLDTEELKLVYGGGKSGCGGGSKGGSGSNGGTKSKSKSKCR